MKLKIVSDGTPHGTKVMDEEGTRLDGVREVGWSIGIDSISCCTLDLVGVPVEVVAEKVEIPSVEFLSLTQEPPLPEEEKDKLEEIFMKLQPNQFDSVKEVVERVKMRRLVQSITRVK